MKNKEIPKSQEGGYISKELADKIRFDLMFPHQIPLDQIGKDKMDTPAQLKILDELINLKIKKRKERKYAK